jgi:hypothetical protein
MSHRHRYGCLGLALMIGCLSGFSHLKQQRRQAEQTRPYGRFTEQQILDRTLFLTSELFPDVPIVHVDPDRTEHLCRRFWDVSCQDNTGRDVALFVWEADTGALYSYRAFRPTRMPRFEARNRSEAVALAYDCLPVMTQTPITSPWRLAGAPAHTAHLWRVYWKQDGRKVTVVLDRRSGQMLSYDRNSPSKFCSRSL